MTMAPFIRRDANWLRYMDEMERSLCGSAVNGDARFRCDISEKDDVFTLEAELPGFEKEDIKVDLDGDTLTISAAHSAEEEKKDEDGRVLRRERRYGSFSRRFDVTGINTDEIKADYKNGILELSLPRRKDLDPPTRRIEIGH